MTRQGGMNDQVKDDRYFKWPRWLRSLGRDRRPDFIIGGSARPYIERWFLLPRNRLLNIYLHRVHRDDDDRALHDHPWANVSVVLRGAYDEVTPDTRDIPTPYLRIADMPVRRRRRRAGSIVFRRAHRAHRLEVAQGPVWTLFLTGPWQREWGFHCQWGWRPWRLFVAADDHGSTGRGCD